MTCEWHDKIFQLSSGGFEAAALDIFWFQSRQNPVYNQFLSALNMNPGTVDRLEDIPFMPISFFKTHPVKTGGFNSPVVFESSGTTGSVRSKHYIVDPELYKRSALECFRLFFGEPKDWCILALLPSYLEQGNSSMVYMMDYLIRYSRHPLGGFYLDDLNKLYQTLNVLELNKQKTILAGVSFALLDFAEMYPMKLEHTQVMETGGMKGRREELTRKELHNKLSAAFGLTAVHSEYGMTELLSQAYSTGKCIYSCPPWMRIYIRDEDDPFELKKPGDAGPVSGAINIIDLANVYSCSFIATEDTGKLYPDGKFEVLGRLDGSDLRGCSLMVL